MSDSFWTSTAGTFKTIEILRVLVYVSAGVFFAETVQSFQFDWSLLNGSRQRRWTQLLYFGAKFSYLAFLIQILVAFWLESEVNCQSYLYAWEFLMGLTVIMSSSLLAFRTIAVHQGRKWKLAVKGLVMVAGLGLTAAWMQGVADVTAIWAPAAASPWNSGACLWTAVKDTYYVKYLITILFDLLVMALTVIGIVKMSTNSRIGNVLVQQGILYFVLTLVANLIITILTLLKLSPTMSLIAAIPQSTICVIASTRLYAQLVEEAKGARPTLNHQASSQMTTTSTSTSSKLTTMLRRHSSFSKGLNGGNSNFDLEKCQPPSTPSIAKKTSLEDVMEDQSSAAIRMYHQQRGTTTTLVSKPSESKLHPFGNLAVLNYDQANGSSSLGMLNMPKITQQVDDEIVIEQEQPQTSTTNATSEELAAKYPRLFRK